MNPPCYRCESTVPLQAGRHGLCPKCEREVLDKAQAPSGTQFCKCGVRFFNDWERIQHEVQQRHNYRAWTPADRTRVTGKDAAA
jgi:NMD protein affecting ribosome stability and mRNA decay